MKKEYRSIFKILMVIIIVLTLSYMTVACGSNEQITGNGQIMNGENENDENSQEDPNSISDDAGNSIMGEVSQTVPELEGHIMIGNVGDFQFDPGKVKTLRNDIFNEGFFSIFDILAYLDDEGLIDMEYHFDESMNTYVIDSLNGMQNWWHIAYYDGGWPERNVFRMDHYPYKDRMYISVSETNEELLDEFYKIFREEVERKETNNGKIIIPEVRIQAPGSGSLLFENVEVKAHNLRNDIFKEDVITAIDVIMTLGDEEEIIYKLNWYESVGTAGLVKNYFVDVINGDISVGRCGFVYEAGSFTFAGFQGNHIHIPPDSRVINTPEYLEFFWICI